MFQRVKENWDYAYSRASERFGLARMQETRWYQKSVHYAVGGVEWYVPMLGQLVALVDWYVVGKLGDKPQPMPKTEDLQKAKLVERKPLPRAPFQGKTAQEFLQQHEIRYTTERDDKIRNLLTYMIEMNEAWEESDTAGQWTARRRVIQGALIMLKQAEGEMATRDLEQRMRTNDEAQLKACWGDALAQVAEKVHACDAASYVQRVDEAFSTLETIAYDAEWMQALYELKRFEAALGVNPQLGKSAYERYLASLKQAVRAWPAHYDTTQFLACPAEPVHAVVVAMEHLCEARASDAINKKEQIDKARAPVKPFQAKDLADYLHHIGLEGSEDLAACGLNTLKDLECLELNRYEINLIKLQQFAVGFTIDPEYEKREYLACLHRIDPSESKLSQAVSAETNLQTLTQLDQDRQRQELRCYLQQVNCKLFWTQIRATQGKTTTLSSVQMAFALQRDELYQLQEQLVLLVD